MFIRVMKLNLFCAQSGQFVAKFALTALRFNEKRAEKRFQYR